MLCQKCELTMEWNIFLHQLSKLFQKSRRHLQAWFRKQDFHRCPHIHQRNMQKCPQKNHSWHSHNHPDDDRNQLKRDESSHFWIYNTSTLLPHSGTADHLKSFPSSSQMISWGHKWHKMHVGTSHSAGWPANHCNSFTLWRRWNLT